MFASIRRYPSLASPVGESPARGTAGIGAVLESVPGWVSLLLIRTREGAILVTVGYDEASLVESGRRVTAWLATQANDSYSAPPDVWVGDVVLTAASEARRSPPQPAEATTHHTKEKS